MLNKSLSALLMAATVFLGACEKEADTYPATGDQCGPDDPVKTLDASDCDILPAGV
ncbi:MULTISPECIES: hypothetical protein [unclassified Ruegeria]|uniref:hypothetical protein n=1 Tax=unclassified Ruegeria TaxID=2625375 RepID=UPI001488B2C5|nr:MULTISPECIES: hypothetical protein [unclassified Ruegeria]